MIQLVLPWLLLYLFLLSGILFLFKRFKIGIVILLATAIINCYYDCFCFGSKDCFSGDIKVLSFNVNGTGVYNKGKLESICNLIEEENPDVLFLTEAYLIPMGDSLHTLLRCKYPFCVRQLEHTVIYSKYYINKTFFIDRLNNGGCSIVGSDISIDNNDIRIYGCHLSSNNYSPDLQYFPPSKISSSSDIIDYFSNAVIASTLREMEADSIAHTLDRGKAIIVMGDMNDISGAPSMRILEKAGMKDAWSKGGFGYGATIHYPLPYRIDHIMYNSGLRLKGVRKIETNQISDHDALVAVFDFIDKKGQGYLISK